MEKRSSVCPSAPTPPRHAALRQGALAVRLQGGGGREDLHPPPRRSMYILRGPGAVFASARLHARLGGRRTAAAAKPDWNPTGERRSRTYRAGKAWNLFCLEEPPFPELCRADPAERSPRAEALRPLKDRKTKRKGEGGGSRPNDGPGLARPPLRADVALLVCGQECYPEAATGRSLGGKYDTGCSGATGAAGGGGAGAFSTSSATGTAGDALSIDDTGRASAAALVRATTSAATSADPHAWATTRMASAMAAARTFVALASASPGPRRGPRECARASPLRARRPHLAAPPP